MFTLASSLPVERLRQLIDFSNIESAIPTVCVSVCFNSSETAGGTSIKLGTIDHHPVVSVRWGLVTSWWRHNQKNFFLNLHYLTEDNRFLLKRKPVSNLTHFKSFHLFGVWNDVTINDSSNNLFFVFSQKVLIAETGLNVLLGAINKLLLIKTTLQHLMFIWLCYKQFII